MKITLPLGRIAATAVCVLLSACAAGRNFGTAASMTPPNPAVGAFLAAHYAGTVDDPAKAAYYYALALKTDPNSPELAENGFLAGLLAGSPQAAELAPSLPHNTLAKLYLGNEALLDGNYSDAATLFKTLPDDQLSGLLEPLLLAWTKYGQGDEPGALALLRPSFNNGPFGMVYMLNAALIADAAGDKLRAAQLYQTIPTTTPNLRLAQILSSWYARQGNTDRANAILNELATIHPDLAIALPQLRAQMNQPVINTPAQGAAEAYLTLAASLSDPQALFLRVVFLRFALELQPDFSAARLILADSQVNTPLQTMPPTATQIKNALATLAPIGPNDPLYGAALLQRATLNAALGQTQTAISLLTHLITDNPGNPGLLAAAGDIRRTANQCTLAIPYYEQAIRLVGHAPPQNSWPLFFDLGMCQDQTGNWAAAEPNLMQALKLSPNQPYVLNYIGYRWAQQGKNLAAAQSMLLRAVSLDPNDGAVLDSLGFVEIQRGHATQAIQLLTQAVQLDPRNAVVNAHLGDAFALAGQTLQAVYQWDRALNLDPDAALQAALKAKLQNAIRTMQP